MYIFIDNLQCKPSHTQEDLTLLTVEAKSASLVCRFCRQWLKLQTHFAPLVESNHCPKYSFLRKQVVQMAAVIQARRSVVVFDMVCS